MKEYICVETGHHKKIPEVIEGFQKRNWRLHTYQTAMKDLGVISHYLLFERETTS